VTHPCPQAGCGQRASIRLSVPRLHAGTGVPSCSKNCPGAHAMPSPMARSAVRSMRTRWSPTTPKPSMKAMPAWSIAKMCQTGLAPRPASANVVDLRSGTVLAWVSPAGFTTVPITASIPLASRRAIAGAAVGVSVMADIVQPGDAPEGRSRATRE
jgi:hypothetical protein